MAFKDRETKNRYHRKHYHARMSSMKRRFENKCRYCNFNDFPEILEFAHIHGTTKNAPVSTLMRQGMDELEKELNKCFLLCPNCHSLYDKGLITIR